MFRFGDDALAHGDEDFHGLLRRVVGAENFGFDGFRDGAPEPLDELHRLFAPTRGKREHDALGLDPSPLALRAVIVHELDRHVGVVNGLRDEPLRAGVRLGAQRLVLVSLLRVSLRDRHPTERASPLSLPQHFRRALNRRSGVLLTRTRASDEIIRARLSRGFVEPRLKFALALRLRHALVHHALRPTARLSQRRGERARIIELSKRKRSRVRRASGFFLNIVHDVPVARQPARLLHEVIRRVRDGVRRRSFQRRRHP